MNKTERPLNYLRGLLQRITLLPLNYTRYNAIIISKRAFCRTGELGVIKIGS